MALQVPQEPLQLRRFPCFEHLRDEGGSSPEVRAPSLLAGGQRQSRGQVRLAGAAVADQEGVSLSLDVLSPHQFLHQRGVDGGLAEEVEGVQRPNDRKSRRLNPPLGGALLPVNHFPLGQPQRIRRIVAFLLRAEGGHRRVFLVASSQIAQEFAHVIAVVEYARNTIAGEERLLWAWPEEAFPLATVPPSLNYGDTAVPLELTSWLKS
jgi:hypothetical protein